MVSFNCSRCQDVVKKPKVQNHANMCGSHSFSCVDCMQIFDLDSIKTHTTCVSEEDKYQGKWKQKLSGNGDKAMAGVTRGIERPPRAPMNDLSTSEESDGDWATGGERASRKAPAPPAAATAAAAPTKSRKHPRPGVNPSSDDDDDDGGVAHPSGKAPAMKRAKAAMATSGHSTPTAHKPHTSQGKPADEDLSSATAVATGTQSMVHMVKVKKDTPLLLPRSTTSTECVVPSFVLGTGAEVADIVADVLADRAVSSMRSKDLAAELVERYAKRIAKSVRHAVETAAEFGSLKMDAKGNVSLL